MNTSTGNSAEPTAAGDFCVYCGEAASTKDHTPPRCLLQRPLPSNLITLPACAKCNFGFSFDESVVLMILTSISPHAELAAAREPGGRLARALERDAKLRAVRDRSINTEGRNVLNEEVLESFRRVFFKTVQGLFFGLYQRVVPPEQLYLAVIDTCTSVTAERIAEGFRPSPMEDITDKPFGDITPSSWHSREPVFIMDLAPASGKGPTTKRIFRLKRETPIEWVEIQKDIFRYAFVKNDGAKSACVMELWETLIVAVTAPWPTDRGPIRRGRKNPLSRD